MKLFLLTLLIGFSAPEVLCQNSTDAFGALFGSIDNLINSIIGGVLNTGTSIIPQTILTSLSGLSIKFICLKKKNIILKDLNFSNLKQQVHYKVV